MLTQDAPDGGQFLAERAFVPFRKFGQCIQQIFQGWCILGWWALTPMICNPATWRTEPRHTPFPGWIKGQGLTAGVTFRAGWKVTLFRRCWHRLKRNTSYEITEQFPVDFDDAWQWVGYSTKGHAVNALQANFEEEMEFLRTIVKTSSPEGGRPFQQIKLTIDCFKAFCLWL